MRRAVSPPPIAPSPDDLASWCEAWAAETGDDAYSRAAAALMRPAPGQRTAATRRALAERDDALRNMAAFFEGSTRQRAIDTLRQIDRYRAGAWRLDDRHRGEMPAAYAGTPFAFAWSICRSGLPVPSERRLRALLRSP